MRSSFKLAAFAVAATCAAGTAVVPAQAATVHHATHKAPRAAAKHVLVLSVDGLHQSDLAWMVRTYPRSAMARLVKRGTSFTQAATTFPSDSFPGMVAQLTGAQPGTSGVYYDDTYSHVLDAPGTKDCKKATPGTEVAWTEGADRSQNPITLDAGQGLKGAALKALPTNTKEQTLAAAPQLTKEILQLTPDAKSLLDPNALPVDPTTCKPIYPHQYVKTNTVFDVAHAAGLRTAWSDKHAAYEILSGPTGTGVDDYFTPEINSVSDAAGDDWTTSNALTREYDGFKVAAIKNELRGYDHSGSKRVGTPAILGMNFQSVSTAQKLPTSEGLTGGYTAKGTPGPLLKAALLSVDRQISELMDTITLSGHRHDTTIILSAKHGQSPINPTILRRVDDGAIIDAVNAAWAAKHPENKKLVAFTADDDGMLAWLSDRSAAAEAFVKNYLMTHDAAAGTIKDAKGVHSTTVAASGLTQVLVGAKAKASVGAAPSDPNAPDLIGIAQHGVVFTGGVKKIAEHGGAAADDRHVPLIVAGPGAARAATVRSKVATAQVAPTILTLLGLDPKKLDGVKADHTRTLPTIR